MADPVTHIAVAHLVKKQLDEPITDDYLLGSIAPDIRTALKNPVNRRVQTHFQDEDDDRPNLTKFLSKYKSYLSNDFVFGYYVHLVTDYYWYMEFLPKFFNDNEIYLLNGFTTPYEKSKFMELVYHDFLCINANIEPARDMLASLFDYKGVSDSLITEINAIELPDYLVFLKKLMGGATNESGIIFDFKMVNDFIINSANKIAKDISDVKMIDKN